MCEKRKGDLLMNRTFKKGMALLVAVVMCICLLPMAAFAIEVVDAPVAGTAYKFGMIQENVSSTTVYYLTGAMDGYYMATTTEQTTMPNSPDICSLKC